MHRTDQLPGRYEIRCWGKSRFFLIPALLSSLGTAWAQTEPEPSVPAPRPFAIRKAEPPAHGRSTPQEIPLTVPRDTPIRVALSKRVRIWREGVPLTGVVTDAVYAFDQPVIPAGSELRGSVKQVVPITKLRRVMGIANEDFSPPHQYTLVFDTLVLIDGRILPIETAVGPGTEQVIHLASGTAKRGTKKGAAGQMIDREKQTVHDRIQQAKVQIKSPGRVDRAKQYLLAQLPYRRQYLAEGTRFDADLLSPLDFGVAKRQPEQLASLGSEIAPDSTLHARLSSEVSSATAHQGAPIEAVVTEPLFDSKHQLVIAADSRIVGKVTRARAARKLHHNGELRVVFERVTTPEGIAQAVQGNLSGVSVDRAANVKIDEEGGTKVTDNKSRYLLTGLSVLIAASAAQGGDRDAPGGPSGINPGQATLAGGSGFKLVGAVVSLAARSRAFSTVLGGYGAGMSVYSHFLARGRDVVLPKDTAVEVAIGDRRPRAEPVAGK